MTAPDWWQRSAHALTLDAPQEPLFRGWAWLLGLSYLVALCKPLSGPVLAIVAIAWSLQVWRRWALGLGHAVFAALLVGGIGWPDVGIMFRLVVWLAGVLVLMRPRAWVVRFMAVMVVIGLLHATVIEPAPTLLNVFQGALLMGLLLVILIKAPARGHSAKIPALTSTHALKAVAVVALALGGAWLIHGAQGSTPSVATGPMDMNADPQNGQGHALLYTIQVMGQNALPPSRPALAGVDPGHEDRATASQQALLKALRSPPGVSFDDDAPSTLSLETQKATGIAQAYWRTNVYYHLQGAVWSRPAIQRTGKEWGRYMTGTAEEWQKQNPGQPVPTIPLTWGPDRPEEDRLRVLDGPSASSVVTYRTQSAGQFTDVVWDHALKWSPSFPMSHDGVPFVNTFLAFSPDGEAWGQSEWSRKNRSARAGRAVWGDAVPNAPYTEPEGLPADGAWALDGPHPTDNPQTRAVAQALWRTHPTVGGFVPAWLAWLDAHSVYDLKRTAQGKQANVADAFLFGNPTLAHGTCVDFATSTVLALRQGGIPARLVSGFAGTQWNPYAQAWVITSDKAHAWVEYYDAPRRQWQRLDPTQAITRRLSSLEGPSNFDLWKQQWSVGSTRSTGGPAVSSKPAAPWAPSRAWGLALAIGLALGFGWAGGYQIWRYWRTPAVVRCAQALQKDLDRTSARWSRHRQAWARAPHEGLVAWVARLDWPEPDRTALRQLAQATQAWRYSAAPDLEEGRRLKAQWQAWARRSPPSCPST